MAKNSGFKRRKAQKHFYLLLKVSNPIALAIRPQWNMKNILEETYTREIICIKRSTAGHCTKSTMNLSVVL